jgi:gamma-D-glutamyl-L-lysine dipeptidyl-peptidase
MALVSSVLKPAANMYSKPSSETDVVSQAIYGTNVEVLEENGNWARIRTPDDYTGWMPQEWLRSGHRYAVSGKVAQVESLFANLYGEPDVTARQPLLTVPFETRLEVAAEKDERWIEVRLADGRPAWIQRGDVTLQTKTMDIAELIGFSKRFLGLPYLWGGTTTFGYDCSGFTQMLLRRRGVNMPRDAGPQARWNGLAAVEREHLQPGDLLYFGKSAEKITHTGMYIGGGEFINATTHERPMVRIDRLDEPHWSGLLVACRRLK